MTDSFSVDVSDLFQKKSAKRFGLTTGSNLPPEIVQQLGDAEKFYIEGNNAEAIKILSNITKQAPRHAEPYKILALIYEEIHADVQVLQLYALSAVFTRKDAKLWEKVYDYGVRTKEYNQAMVAINRAIALDKERKIYYQERLGLFVKLGSIRVFKDMAKVFIKKYPHDYLIFSYLGDMLYDSYYYGLAKNYYEQFYLRFFPNKELFLSSEDNATSSIPTQNTSTIPSSGRKAKKGSTDAGNSASSAAKSPALSYTHLFTNRQQIEKIIYAFMNIIYVTRQYSHLLLQTNDYYRLILLIENFFIFYHQCLEYYEEHQQDFEHEIIPSTDEEEEPSYDRLIPEEFPIDLLLLLGLVKLFTHQNEDEINQALQIINPIITTLQQNPFVLFPQTIYSTSSQPQNNSNEDAMDVVTASSPPVVKFDQRYYEFDRANHPDREHEDDEEENQPENTTNSKADAALKKAQKEEKERKRLLKMKQLEENIVYQRKQHYRNIYKEEERIRFHIIYYLTFLSSLFLEIGMKNRGKKMFSYLFDNLLTMDYLLAQSYTSLMVTIVYELLNYDEEDKANQLLSRVFEVNPYSIEAMVAYSKLLVKSGDESELLRGLLKMESVFKLVFADIDRMIKKINDEQDKKKKGKKSSEDGDEEEDDEDEDDEEDEEEKENEENLNTSTMDIDVRERTEANDLGIPVEEDIIEKDVSKGNEDIVDEDELAMNEILEASYLQPSSAASVENLPLGDSTSTENNINTSRIGDSATTSDSPIDGIEDARKRLVQFPFFSNHFGIHRHRLHQLLEFTCNYICLVCRIPSTYLQRSLLGMQLLDIQCLKITVIDALLKGSRSRLKSRETILTKMIKSLISHQYCKKRVIVSEGESTAMEVVEGEKHEKGSDYETLNPVINVIQDFIASMSSTKGGSTLSMTQRFYSLLMSLAEYVSIDQFFPRQELAVLIESLTQDIPMIIEQLQTAGDTEKRNLQEVIPAAEQLLKLYDSYVPQSTNLGFEITESSESTKTLFLHSHGMKMFYNFYHQILTQHVKAMTGNIFTLENSNNHSTSEVSQLIILQSMAPQFSFIYPQNIQQYSISYLQDRFHPTASTSTATTDTSNSSSSAVNSSFLISAYSTALMKPIEDITLDIELQYLRKNINIRQYRGQGKRQTAYEQFMNSAQRLSFDCKNLAEAVYNNPTNLPLHNVFYRTIVQKTMEHYEKNRKRNPSHNNNDDNHHGRSENVPFPSRIKSLYLENVISVRGLLSTDSESFIPYYLIGNEYAVYKKHNDVVEHYLKAFMIDPNQPLLALCIGAYLIMLCSHPLSKDRMSLLIKGYGFLCYYRELRTKKMKERFEQKRKEREEKIKSGVTVDETKEKEKETEDIDGDEIRFHQESLYNLGRSFHEIKFLHLACHFYQQCLELADLYPFLLHPQTFTFKQMTTAKPSSSQPSTFPSMSGGGTQMNLKGFRAVTLESAHNLILIYRKSGSKDLALSIMRKYLMFV